MKGLLFVWCFTISFILIGQSRHDRHFEESYNRYIHKGIPTIKILTDSILKSSINKINNMPLSEFEIVDSILKFEIKNSSSLQSEFHWNLLYNFILERNNFIGKNFICLNRNLEIAKELDNNKFLAIAFDQLSEFYLNHNLPDEALSFLWQARDYASAAGDSLLEKEYSGKFAWKLTNIGVNKLDKALQDSAVTYANLAYLVTDPRNSGSYEECSFIAALCLARAHRRLECAQFMHESMSKVSDESLLRGRFYELLQEQFYILNMKDSAYFYIEKNHSWNHKYQSNRMPQITLDDGRNVFVESIPSAIRVYLHFKDYQKAVNLIEKIIKNDEITDPGLINYFKSLGVIAYQGLGNDSEALKCQLAYNEYADSIKNVIDKMNAQTDREIFEASIFLEQQNAEEAKNQQKIISQTKEGNRKLLFSIFFIGILSLVIILIIVYTRFKKTKAQKQIIEEQKIRVEEAHHEIQDSIAYAKRIQKAILPSDRLIASALQESFVIYKPKDVVAGDFYWLEQFKQSLNSGENGVLFAAADCTGHGVPGAMVSVICNGALNRAVREFGLTTPGLILDKAREIVIQEFEKSEEVVKDGMDIALCSIVGRKLKFAGANNPVWIVRNNEILETKGDKQPVGSFSRAKSFTTHDIALEEGDLIYLFSDGYVDQFGGEKGKKLRTKYLRELLIQIKDKTMSEQKTFLDNAFELWRGTLDQIDDVCLFGVRVY